MGIRTLSLCLTVSTALAAGAAVAQVAETHAQSVSAGKDLALEICANCHVVTADQPYKPLLEQKTPSFAQIADNPLMTPGAIRRYITNAHWDEKSLPAKMPNLKLMDYQKDEIVDYITSLRKPR